MFGFRTVHLCNYALIKETFDHPDITNRPEAESVHFMTDGVEAGKSHTKGVVMSLGCVHVSHPMACCRHSNQYTLFFRSDHDQR